MTLSPQGFPRNTSFFKRWGSVYAEILKTLSQVRVERLVWQDICVTLNNLSSL